MAVRPHVDAPFDQRGAATRAGDNRLPAFAWLMFALSLALTLAAAIIFMGKSSEPALSSVAESADTQKAGNATKTSAATSLTLSPAPFDITDSMLKAKRRAKEWHPEAVLTGLEAIVSETSKLESLSIEYGQAIGKSGHRAPVNSLRLLITTVGNKTTSQELTKPSLRRALAEPSCPLEVALRKWRDSGADSSGHLGVMLTESDKHGRLVWMITSASEETYSIDAQSCALLRR